MAIEMPEMVQKSLDAPIQGIRAFLLTGRAGVGKTALTEKVAKEWGAEYVFIQCTPGMTETELIYTVLPSEETVSGVKLIEGKLLEAVKASCHSKVVLCLDEWDKTRPTADAFLLDFLQNCRVSWRTDGESVVEGKSENMIVFLTSNNERDFSEPLLRRVIVIPIEPLSPSEIKRVLEEEYGVCKEHAPLLTQLYADTIEARLDKPATIQELVQLEQMIHRLSEPDWDELVFSLILKTDEQAEIFKEYLRRNHNRRKW